MSKLVAEIQLSRNDIIELCKTEQFINEQTSVKNCVLSFLKSMDTGGVIKVEYTQKKEGRFWGQPDMNALPRWIKQTLLHKKYVDVDISNCHSSILLKLCIKYNIESDALAHYCCNRSTCLEEISKIYKVDTRDAKDLFNVMNFGGGFDTWLDDKKIPKAQPTEFIKKYYEEAKGIKEQFACIPEYKRFFDMAKAEKDNPYDIINSGMSLIMQYYEATYLKKALELVNQSNSFIPAHDGFYLSKDRFKSTTLPQFIEMVNQYVNEDGIIFVEKEMTEVVDLKAIPMCEINFWKHFDLYDIATEIIKKNEFIACNGVLYSYNGVYWEADTPEKNYYKFADFWSKKYYYVIENLMQLAFGQKESSQPKKQKKRKRGQQETEETDFNEDIKSIKAHQKAWEKELIKSRVQNFRALVVLVLQRCENSKLKFNTNTNLFAFTNKIFDIEKNEFIEPRPDQYISETCGYDYVEPSDLKKEKDHLMNIFKTILPYEYDLNLFLKYCSTGLSATLIEKILIAHGSGRNGKGLFQEFNKHTLGNYFYALSPSSIQSELRTGPNQELANIEGKRLVTTSEPAQDKKISTSILKLITGCSTINARGLHSKKTDTSNYGTYILECNSKPKLDIVEQAITQRLFVIHFPVKFIDKEVYEKMEDKDGYGIVNTKYKENAFLQKYKMAYFHILADAYQEYVKNQSFLLNEVSKSFEITDQYFKDSDEFTSWFYSNYKKVETSDLVYLADIRKEYVEHKKQTEHKFDIKLGTFYEKLNTCPILSKFVKQRDQHFNSTKLKKPALCYHVAMSQQEKDDLDTSNEIGILPVKDETQKPVSAFLRIN